MTKKITIVIPAYDQADLCRGLLESIRRQTFKDFSILILDDCSPKSDYKKLIANFTDLDITYSRNEKNLGAMKNMENALHVPLSSSYRIVFHEDDLMHPQLLEKESALLDSNDRLAFVGTNMLFFNTENELTSRRERLFTEFPTRDYKEQKEMVVDFCRGTSFCFGSVMYRNSALNADIHFDLDSFGTLSDRPLLLGLMTPNLPEAAFINEKLVFYRAHGATDNRSRTLRAEQLITFYSFYRSFFPATMTRSEKRVFYNESTNNILDSYTRIYPDMTIPFDQFLSKAHEKGLISFWYLNRGGIKALFRIFLKRT